MRKFFSFFWILFFLYFIFVHPAIIYYGSEFPRGNLQDVNPTGAFVYLGISLVLWLGIFLILFRLIVKYTIQSKRNIAKINQTGKRLEAHIVEVRSSPVFKGNTAFKSVVLMLKNFENETIQYTLDVNDVKPEQRRFEKGKIVYLRVDPTFKKHPFIILEGTQGKVNSLFFVLWMLLLTGLLYYYYFSYHLESEGFGWRFLSFSHPILSSAGFLILFTGIIYGVLKFAFFKKMNLGTASLILKFKGKKALGRIHQVQQTGTYINDQPEVQLDLVFTDHFGHVHEVQIKKIVSLLEVGNMKDLKECILFYDPKDPKKVKLDEDAVNK